MLADEAVHRGQLYQREQTLVLPDVEDQSGLTRPIYLVQGLVAF